MKKLKYILFAFIIYVLSICSIGIIEKSNEAGNIKSIGDAFWYAIVTLTTVGYGDKFPVTIIGKIIGLLLIIGSIGVLGFIIGEITSKFNQYMEKKKNGFWGTDFENHYIIIGWSDFGRQVAQQIFNAGHKVAFVVNTKSDLDIIKDVFPSMDCFCMFADYNNFEAYRKVNILKSKGVFVNFEEDTETLVFVLDLKKEFPEIDIVVTCKNPVLKATFKNAGIYHVVAQSEVASRLVASYIFEPQVANYTEDLISTSVTDFDFDIQQYKVTESNTYIGELYLDIFHKLKENLNATLIGLVIDGNVVKNPAKDYKLKAGDYLIIISDGIAKKEMEETFGIKEGE